MQLVRAIRLAALRAILNQRQKEPKNDPEYFTRHVMRWYSKKFYTPLDQVEQLPIEDILQAFYEERYEDMDDDALERERLEVLKTEEDYEKEARQRDMDNYDSYETMMWAKRDEERAAKKREEAKNRKEQGLTIKTPAPKSGLNAGMSKQAELVSLSDLKQAPPSISMTFVSEEELGLDGDSLGILEPPPKRQG